MEKNQKPVVEFENINLDEIAEMEEVVTAAAGTLSCCKQS